MLHVSSLLSSSTLLLLELMVVSVTEVTDRCNFQLSQPGQLLHLVAAVLCTLQKMQFVFSLWIHAPRKKVASSTVPSLVTFSIFFTSLDLPCFFWTGWGALSHCCHYTTSSRGASFMTMSSQAGHLSHLFIMYFSLVLSQTKWSTNDPEYEGKLGSFFAKTFTEHLHIVMVLAEANLSWHGCLQQNIFWPQRAEFTEPYFDMGFFLLKHSKCLFQWPD